MLPPASPQHTYRLAKIAKDVYSSKDATGANCIIFVISELGAIGRRYHGLELRFSRKCTVKIGATTSSADVGMLHCRDPMFDRQFEAIRTAVVEKLKTDPDALATADGVVHFVDSFARAFQPVRERLQRDAELGLWGELQAMLMMPKADRAVEAWQGPSRFIVDYSRNGIDVEVKASTRGHLHRIKHEQAIPPPSPQTERYLLSLAAELDPAGGETVAELADRALARAKNKLALQVKLAEYGYEDNPATPYTTRWTLVAAKSIRQEALPTLPAFPSQIIEVDFTLDANDLLAVPSTQFTAALKQLTS